MLGGKASAAPARAATGSPSTTDVVTDGAVGVLLGPGVDVATVVSQGCRPIGQPFVVTRAERNIVYELGGQPAYERLLDTARRGLSDDEIALVNQGLFMGLVIDEHKLDFGPGDFLVRNVMGFDPENGAIAVGDVVEVGTTAQFHVRDAATADEDLRRLLAGRQADGRPRLHLQRPGHASVRSAPPRRPTGAGRPWAPCPPPVSSARASSARSAGATSCTASPRPWCSWATETAHSFAPRWARFRVGSGQMAAGSCQHRPRAAGHQRHPGPGHGRPQKANSGHPGTAMALAPLAHVLWTRVMRYDPSTPDWPDRDRFILSAGHASILLYSMLYLTGYGLTLDDIQAVPPVGQRDARAPRGAPHRRASRSRPGRSARASPTASAWASPSAGCGPASAPRSCDHHTFVICSDGDLEEGISHEAASLAGHLGLGRLVYVYDDNHITIDGPTELAFSDDAAAASRPTAGTSTGSARSPTTPTPSRRRCAGPWRSRTGRR